MLAMCFLCTVHGDKWMLRLLPDPFSCLSRRGWHARLVQGSYDSAWVYVNASCSLWDLWLFESHVLESDKAFLAQARPKQALRVTQYTPIARTRKIRKNSINCPPTATLLEDKRLCKLVLASTKWCYSCAWTPAIYTCVHDIRSTL